MNQPSGFSYRAVWHVCAAMFVQMLLTEGASAQPIFTRVDSVQWMVCDSARIVRGTIAKVDSQPTENDYVWSTVTLDVKETLKGDHDDALTMLVHHYKSVDDLQAWRDGQADLLVFLVDTSDLPDDDRRKQFRHAPRSATWRNALIELRSKDPPTKVWTMQMTSIEQPEEILKEVRRVIAEAPAVEACDEFSIQHGLTIVRMPIDDRLLRLARQRIKGWAESPGTSAFDRQPWVQALSHFPSDENSALLTSLLDDPTYYVTTEEVEPWTAVERREYAVRAAAYNTRKKWNRPVKEPVLREELLRKETDPSHRGPITKVIEQGGNVDYAPLKAPGKYRQLESISMSWREPPDLTPLIELGRVKRLYLGEKVKDISPLAKMQLVEDLNGGNSAISDLAPLANLTSLKSLSLFGTKVDDLSPLARLTNLTSLDVAGTEVSDLSPLAALTNLQYLELAGTRVQDLSPLAGLLRLKRLNVQGTLVRDISPLAGLENLERLDLNDTSVHDISPLARLTRVTHLDLSGSPVSDISALTDLTQLTHLNLSETPIVDLAPIIGHTKIWPLPPAYLPIKSQ